MDNIIKYLEEYKAKYSKEALIDALLKGGYKNEDIKKGIKAVYGDTAVLETASPFWNFRVKRSYEHNGDKVLDFLLGILFAALLFGSGKFLSVFSRCGYYYSYGYSCSYYSVRSTIRDLLPLYWLAVGIFYIAGLIFFFRKRKFIFWGLLAAPALWTLWFVMSEFYF